MMVADHFLLVGLPTATAERDRPHLVTLILKRKGMAEANPSHGAVCIQGSRLAKIAPGLLVLMGGQVIDADRIP